MSRIITLMIAFFMLQACKKEEKKKCTITKIVGVNSLSMYGEPDSSITMIQYDKNKVMKSLEKINSGRPYETTLERTYEYDGERLVKINEDHDGIKNYYAISYDDNDHVNAVDYSGFHKLSYVYANGKLSKISYRHVTSNLGLGEHDIEFTYAGNNVSKVTETWIPSGPVNTWLFSYGNIPNTHFKNEFFPDYFAYSDSYTLAYTLSEDLVSKIESSGGGVSTFGYTFSRDGKVSGITETFTSSVNNYSKKANYEYNCQ